MQYNYANSLSIDTHCLSLYSLYKFVCTNIIVSVTNIIIDSTNNYILRLTHDHLGEGPLYVAG